MTQRVPAGRAVVAGQRAHAGHSRSLAERNYMPPLLGLITVAVIGLIFAVAVGLFQGSFTESIPVTVIGRNCGRVTTTIGYTKSDCKVA